MKRLIALIFVISFMNASFAQAKRKVVTIQAEQSFYLNGGARSMMGGVSRTYLKIDLPPNTIEWYYIFSTTPSKGQKASIDLAAQLTKLFDPTGITEIAVEALFAPSGSSYADVYLFQNIGDLNQFLSKEDMKGGRLNYILSGTREHLTQGTIQMKDNLQGTYYIGLRNPSTAEGLNVSIEVAAIVKVTSESQSEAESYGNIGWKEYQEGNYDKSVEYSKKALGLDSAMSWVQFNIALNYLVSGKDEAMDAYVKALGINERVHNGKQVLSVAINNIDDAKKKNSNLKDVDIIRQLLFDRYNKYQ